MKNAQTKQRRPAPTVTVRQIRSQARPARPAGRFTTATAVSNQAAPQPTRLSRANTASGGVIIK